MFLRSFLILFISLFSLHAECGGEFSGGSAQIFRAAMRSHKIRKDFQRWKLPGSTKTVNPYRDVCFDSDEGGFRTALRNYDDRLFPVKYEELECVEWTAGNSRQHTSKAKFTDKSKAWKYSREFEKPYFKCTSEDWVSKEFPRVFQVKMFSDDVAGEAARYRYKISTCELREKGQVVEKVQALKELNTELL